MNDKVNEEAEKIYSDIRNIVAGKNGGLVCEVLGTVMADIIALYCDAHKDDSDAEGMIDSIALHIKEAVKVNRELKEI